MYGPTICKSEEEKRNCYCVLKTHLLSLTDVHELITDYFSNDNLGIESKPSHFESKDDAKATIILKNTSKRIGNRFETGLLWISNDICLPESFNMAKTRLMYIEKKMSLNEEFASGYRKE